MEHFDPLKSMDKISKKKERKTIRNGIRKTVINIKSALKN